MPNRARIEIDGARRVQRLMRQVPEQRDRLKALNRSLAADVADAARPLVPVRSGTLRASVRSGGGATAGVVRAGSLKVPYAGVIHFGYPRRGIRPTPFLYDAADRRASEVVEAYLAGIQDIIDEQGIGPE